MKNLNLRVYPPKQKIQVSAPRSVPDSIIEDFLRAKLPWIREQLSKTEKFTVAKDPAFIDGEKHSIWGKEYQLKIVEEHKSPKVILKDNMVKMHVRPGSDNQKKAKVLKEWYRAELKKEIPKLIKKWEPIMNVSVTEFGVKDMKTRWGTCNIRAQRIWLNLQLAKKRPELLEYVVVHEMTHLHERLHNKRFYGLMKKFLPNWKSLKNELNGKNSMKNC
ncbi:MAG: SprT family zinc-dependent metalloprotease [Gracilimonas sp.]|nr:SprT family zinc-dependent metalloprotease [Gracilimonas sp.]